MISRPSDLFEDWFATPLPVACSDPNLDVRRLRPDDFPRVYDLVDTAFEAKRPRAQFDWMYRDNPNGVARCWAVIERSSGDIVNCSASFPWPIQRGSEPAVGILVGDSATHPRWQRRGISELNRPLFESHPLRERSVSMSGPNEKSAGQMRKHGRGDRLQGPLPAAAVFFETRAALEGLGAPKLLAKTVGFVADGVLATWRNLALAGGRDAGRVERVTRFEGDFDAVTERWVGWDRWWCPHSAEFLNWRYFAHPTCSFTALALLENDRPQGYCVVRLDEGASALVDFCADPERSDHVQALLRDAIATARAAGSAYLSFFAPQGWPHWGALRRVGFLPYPAKNYFSSRSQQYPSEVRDLANWRLFPSDRDYH